MHSLSLAIDLMARGREHSLYHLGFLSKNPGSWLYLHESSKISEAAAAFEEGPPSRVCFYRGATAYFLILRNAFCRDGNVEILGAHLRQLVILGPVLAFLRARAKIHLHGQAYALKSKASWKYWYWRALSLLGVELVVSNPAYRGPDFVRIISNVNCFKKFRSDVGSRRDTPLDSNSMVMKKRSGEIETYSAYVRRCKSHRCRYIDLQDDYYSFSPSGRISEAKMFDQKVLVRAGPGVTDGQVEMILGPYEVEFEIL